MNPKPAGFRQDKPLTEAEAEALTAEIVDKLTAAYREVSPLIVRAFRGRAWNAVGYTSWDDYCRANFHGPRMLRFTDDQLTELCREFAGEGMSGRAIGSALGIGHATAARKVRKAGQDEDGAKIIRLSDGAEINRSREAAKAAHPAGKRLPVPAPAPVVVPTGMRPAEIVLMHISLSAGEGLTYAELCAITEWRDAPVTGALSVLARAGRIRQVSRRDGNAVWVES